METLEKIKETALSVLPVSAMVLLAGMTFVKFPDGLLLWFALSTVLVIVGLAIFLMGVRLGASHVGERCGAALTGRRSVALLVGVAFVIGAAVTIAEPDIQVFGAEVSRSFANVMQLDIMLAIALGVAVCLALGVFRIISGIPLKWALFAMYLLALALMPFAPRYFIGVAFDAGGATTGPMTVPFILALGMGVSAVSGGKDGGFGLTGIASIGPLCAALAYSMLRHGLAPAEAAEEVTAAAAFGISGAVLVKSLWDVVVSAAPLYALVLAMQPWLLKMTRRQLLRATTGFVQSALGLFIFLIGVRCGFTETGRLFGEALGARIASGSDAWFAATILLGIALGGVTVCAEPAVWVLGEQVEQVSGGLLRRKSLLVFLASATALAVALAILRAVFGFHIAWFVVPGYAVALLLLPFTPGIFSGIAFDSGGVASGPLTTTFVLSFTLGVASGYGNASDAFGVIALVAMMPLVAIQLMGLAMEKAKRRGQGGPGAAAGNGEVSA